MKDRNSNDEHRFLSFSNLQIKSRLGRGSTSHVMKTQSIRTKKYYAMKVIDKYSTLYKPSALLREIEIHKKLKCENICQFIKHFEDESNHYIVTQYCKDGELTNMLLKQVGQPQILKVAYQVGSALNYMHNQAGFAHGDLKLSNILINESNLKLCDFGFSVDLTATQENQQQLNGAFGTLIYMAPQLLKNNFNKHYKQADIWAFGICLLSLMLKGKPYTADSNLLLKKQIMNGQYIKPSKQIFPHFSQQLLNLIQSILEPDYRFRIKIQEILNHKLFGKFRKLNINRQRSISAIQFQSQNIENDKRLKLKTRKSEQIMPNYQAQSQEREEGNKSIFNNTVDTSTQIQQNQSIISLNNTDNYKNCFYCLKPQLQKIDQNGSIQILKDRSAKINIKKTQYIISPDANSLEIIAGSKNIKKFTYQQIKQNQKVVNLYKYGLQLINILKKKQILVQQIINGKYFWATKKTIGALIDNKTILQRNLQQNEISIIKLISSEQIIDSQKYIQHFEKGQKHIKSRINKIKN